MRCNNHFRAELPANNQGLGQKFTELVMEAAQASETAWHERFNSGSKLVPFFSSISSHPNVFARLWSQGKVEGGRGARPEKKQRGDPVSTSTSLEPTERYFSPKLNCHHPVLELLEPKDCTIKRQGGQLKSVRSHAEKRSGQDRTKRETDTFDPRQAAPRRHCQTPPGQRYIP